LRTSSGVVGGSEANGAPEKVRIYRQDCIYIYIYIGCVVISVVFIIYIIALGLDGMGLGHWDQKHWAKRALGEMGIGRNGNWAKRDGTKCLLSV
jgi:hypothetical protein